MRSHGSRRRKLHLSFSVDVGFDDRDLVTGSGPGLFAVGGRYDQRSRAGVFEIKLKLVHGVRRVEGRGCAD